MGALREKVLSTPLRTVEVETEAYGTVRLRELTLAERVNIHTGLPADAAEYKRLFAARLIRLSVVREDGGPEFSEADELMLSDRFNGSDGERICAAISELNQLGSASLQKKRAQAKPLPAHLPETLPRAGPDPEGAHRRADR